MGGRALLPVFQLTIFWLLVFLRLLIFRIGRRALLLLIF
jgi:hypothetical protein